MSLYKKSGSRFWWYDFVFNGQRIQRSSKVENRREARNIEKAAWTQLARGEVGIEEKPKVERKTVGELLDGLLANYEQNGKDSKPNLSTLKGARQAFGTKMSDTLTTEQVEHYVEKRLHEGARPATVNRTLEVVRRAYKIANIEPPKIRHLSEKDNVRKGFFSATEFRAVLAHLPSDLKDFVLFGYLTGWRKGSITNLRWADVDREAKEINLPGKYVKNGEPLKMAIEGEMTEVMARRWEARAVRTDSETVISALVFHRGGEPVREFRKSWATATKQAGCGGKLFHDLRRSAARDLVRAGVPQSVAMTITGHKTASMFTRYNITDDTDVRDAMRRVQSYREAGKQKAVSMGGGGD